MPDHAHQAARVDWRDLTAALLSRLSVPAAVIDVSGAIGVANQPLASLFGTRAAALRGCVVLDRLTPAELENDDGPSWRERRTLRVNGSSVLALVNVERHGSERLMEITIGVRAEGDDRR